MLCAFLQQLKNKAGKGTMETCMPFPDCISHISSLPKKIERKPRDFPGGPVVKTPSFHAGGTGSITGQGTKISYAKWPN